MEMPAPLALILTAPMMFRNKRINMYMGNDTDPNTPIMGGFRGDFLSSAIRTFWILDEPLIMAVWIGS